MSLYGPPHSSNKHSAVLVLILPPRALDAAGSAGHNFEPAKGDFAAAFQADAKFILVFISLPDANKLWRVLFFSRSAFSLFALLLMASIRDRRPIDASSETGFVSSDSSIIFSLIDSIWLPVNSFISLNSFSVLYLACFKCEL